MAKWRLSLLLLGAILLIVGGIALMPRPQPTDGPTEPGRMSQQEALLALDALALPTVDGKLTKLSDWKGKVRVINFWATWCVPCREEMPAFSRLQERFVDKSVQFVGISIDPADKIREFTKTTPVSYPLLVADMGTLEISAGLGNSVRGLPFTVILDRQGQVWQTKLGRLSEDELAEKLRYLLQK